jgi:hypothetical protein
MKSAIRCLALATLITAPLSVQTASVLHAQTSTGTNNGLPGGHPESDTNKREMASMVATAGTADNFRETRIDYASSGVVCTIDVPLRDVRPAGA